VRVERQPKTVVRNCGFEEQKDEFRRYTSGAFASVSVMNNFQNITHLIPNLSRDLLFCCDLFQLLLSFSEKGYVVNIQLILMKE